MLRALQESVQIHTENSATPPRGVSSSPAYAARLARPAGTNGINPRFLFSRGQAPSSSPSSAPHPAVPSLGELRSPPALPSATGCARSYPCGCTCTDRSCRTRGKLSVSDQQEVSTHAYGVHAFAMRVTPSRRGPIALNVIGLRARITVGRVYTR